MPRKPETVGLRVFACVQAGHDTTPAIVQALKGELSSNAVSAHLCNMVKRGRLFCPARGRYAVAGSEGVPMSICQACHQRFSQGGGFCRACARAVGYVPPTVAERDKALESLQRRVERPKGQPIRTVTIRGQEFDVMFDGT